VADSSSSLQHGTSGAEREEEGNEKIHGPSWTKGSQDNLCLSKRAILHNDAVNMHRPRIGVVGASGYSGLEATRFLLGHPFFELGLIISDRWQGEAIKAHLSCHALAAQMDLIYHPLKDSVERARGLAAVLLCTPAETSIELVPPLLQAGVRVVDLSGSFRLRDASQYRRFYHFEHPQPTLLSESHYGLPELFEGPFEKTRLVANPGCYATCTALALGPLVRANLLAEEGIVIDAASGISGAGRRATEEYSFCEVSGDYRAYRVLRHQHSPEITQTLSTLGRYLPPCTFTPHLLPVQRGLLVTAYARLKKGIGPESVRKAFLHTYAKSPFVRLLASAEGPRLHEVVGTNDCVIGFAVEEEGADAGRLVVTAAIDNLVKGASGQAVQNLNLMFGLDHRTGLVPGPWSL
jgi:N-acetyl-gamma-glutamyl-phosphate reductase